MAHVRRGASGATGPLVQQVAEAAIVSAHDLAMETASAQTDTPNKRADVLLPIAQFTVSGANGASAVEHAHRLIMNQLKRNNESVLYKTSAVLLI